MSHSIIAKSDMTKDMDVSMCAMLKNMQSYGVLHARSLIVGFPSRRKFHNSIFHYCFQSSNWKLFKFITQHLKYSCTRFCNDITVILNRHPSIFSLSYSTVYFNLCISTNNNTTVCDKIYDLWVNFLKLKETWKLWLILILNWVISFSELSLFVEINWEND